jgi:hypothetical protein
MALLDTRMANSIPTSSFFSHIQGPTGVMKTPQDILRDELLAFYSNREYLQRMSSVIERKLLRLLDWFVCNYSKEYYTIYKLERDGNSVLFKVYIDYKINLDIYSKKRFAPFCRHERIMVPFDDQNNMETTIGQLNFFRWVFRNNVLEYFFDHEEEIRADYDKRNGSRKNRASSDRSFASTDSPESSDAGGVGGIGGKTRKKREELSSSACRSIRFTGISSIL